MLKMSIVSALKEAAVRLFFKPEFCSLQGFLENWDFESSRSKFDENEHAVRFLVGQLSTTITEFPNQFPPEIFGNPPDKFTSALSNVIVSEDEPELIKHLMILLGEYPKVVETVNRFNQLVSSSEYCQLLVDEGRDFGPRQSELATKEVFIQNLRAALDSPQLHDFIGQAKEYVTSTQVPFLSAQLNTPHLTAMTHLEAEKHNKKLDLSH